MSTPRPPATLGPEGRAFWRRIHAAYELAPHEALLLAQAARLVDLLARLDRELGASDLVTVGSRGQPRANPLLDASATQRRTLAAMVRGLALPAPDEERPLVLAAERWRWGTG